ncbi:hypothetical protein [Clostridium estertheticum]|nr:hypothetical protein [Clostridium estertheticum]MBW9152339.1 hypothetical protein [Clostridium estertheticum]MBW9173981.1 hypothetical protein [Clostridium estertheticum]WLC77266.1 hypothetical protein KTC99_10980 [Clostridium estertheticum]WLC82805.1 hypothetical protein KTC97_11755 [Clostridium estertheticum]
MSDLAKKDNVESKIPSQEAKKEYAKTKIEAGNEISISKDSKKIGKM